MKDKDLSVAKELKRRMSAIVPIVELRVFGSRARGYYDEYSDMDVFIEVEATPFKASPILKNIYEEGQRI